MGYANFEGVMRISHNTLWNAKFSHNLEQLASKGHIFLISAPNRARSVQLARNPVQSASLQAPAPFQSSATSSNLGKNPINLYKSLQDLWPCNVSQLGVFPTIVVSSPETAKEVLHRNDQAFSGRAVLGAVKAHNHHESSVIWSPTSAYWRKIRKICPGKCFRCSGLKPAKALGEK
ncbi:Ferruginol synthase [Vitis vinifera]|uniref:Ferruginol synthase n=1 Tax=Vitis vinifera TaxID=29760 RepID=A0A438IWI1_VITVI|nr:Ferruginol synthase [Vitis vinifera]